MKANTFSFKYDVTFTCGNMFFIGGLRSIRLNFMLQRDTFCYTILLNKCCTLIKQNIKFLAYWKIYRLDKRISHRNEITKFN